MNNYQGYVYITTNLINGKKYIGSRKLNSPTLDSCLKDAYLGSGKAFKLAVTKYGKNNFKKEIILICDNVLFYENLILQNIKPSEKFDENGEKLYYNLKDYSIGGSNNFNHLGSKRSEDTKSRMRDAKKRYLHSIGLKKKVTTPRDCKYSCIFCKKELFAFRFSCHVCDFKKLKSCAPKSTCPTCKKEVYSSRLSSHLKSCNNKFIKIKNEDGRKYKKPEQRLKISETLKHKYKTGEISLSKEHLDKWQSSLRVKQCCILCKREFDKGNYSKHIKICK